MLVYMYTYTHEHIWVCMREGERKRELTGSLRVGTRSCVLTTNLRDSYLACPQYMDFAVLISKY